MDFSEAFERFEGLCQPSSGRCINCTAALRAMVRKIVTERTRCGQAIEVTDQEIHAEAAAIRATFPAGSFVDCPGCAA